DTYRIERILGQGGFGITYLATDLSLERYVAIKEFFPKDYCDREESTSHITVGTSSNVELVSRLKAKFLKEARNIAKFDHPGIIKIHTAFEENNTAYYVMDYIEGCNLYEIVKSSGPLSESKAVNYITQVGDALDYIHKHNVNHLDIKPANIMIRKSDDRPILIDFGLSKQYDSEGNQTSTTPTGISHGYAPMEQYKVGGVSEFSPQTDVYSLAATLYYLISGKIPPHATDLIEESISFPAGFPMNLQKAISKAMSSARKNRHESVSKFVGEINDGDESEVKQIIQATTARNHNRVNIDDSGPSNIRKSQNIDTSNYHNDSYSSKVSKASTVKTAKSHYKSILIGGCVTVAIIFLILMFRKPEGSVDASDLTTNDTALVASPSFRAVDGIYYKSSLGACSYTGEVDSEGKPHGKGKAEWETGLGKSYDGQWVHGEMDGDCTYLSRGGYRFEGKFRAGHYFEGKLISPDKSYYEGTFDKKGEKWTGTEYDSNGIKIDTWKNGE
ncbi:MAG: protein kinase, partial [Paramuribaculum sp.]|nr:protein kinase [Paramuribaculum sp.]